MSIASISTVLILSLIFGVFIIIIANMNYWSENMVRQLQIVVYLSDDINDKQIGVIKTSLETTPYIDKIRFVSKDEALAAMRKKLKNQLELGDIGRNPLPNSFEVIVKEPDKIPAVAAMIKEYPGIDRVRYGEKVASKILTVNRAIHYVGLLILAALFLSTIFIVSNTIRLTVFARRKEIGVMQLVGAANWFIRWPFILEGVLQGLIGAVIAFFILKISYFYYIPQVRGALPFLIVVDEKPLFGVIAFALIGTGIFVGAMGSVISINKFLRLQYGEKIGH
jgi:cell division transport system permease protein